MKYRVGLVLIFSFLFFSCTMNISNQEYIEIASGYLIENFGGEYTFVSLKKASDNEVYVLLKSEKLDKQEVNVRIIVSDQQIDSYTCQVSSNYLSIMFENEEKEYYERIFKTYFTDCKIVMHNEARFLDYDSVYWVSDEITGEWIEHTNTLNFEQYLNILEQSKNTAFADIIVTDKSFSKYLDSEDKLKCSLVDLQHAKQRVDGNFYIVNELEDNYSESWTFKADIDIYEGQYDGFRYGFEIEKA